YHLYFNGVAEAVMVAQAAAHQPSKIEEVKPIPDGDGFRNIPNKALQRSPVSENARNYIARVDFGHPAGYQLQSVVGCVVSKSAHHNGVAGLCLSGLRESGDDLHLVIEAQIDG